MLEHTSIYTQFVIAQRVELSSYLYPVNIDEIKEIGGYSLFVLGATKVIHWCSKKIDELQKYNKDRDEADSELIKDLSGVIKENNINQKTLIDNQKLIISNQNKILLMLNSSK